MLEALFLLIVIHAIKSTEHPGVTSCPNHPGATRHPSIEGNKTGASVFTARSAKIIPLYGGVARSAGVV
ncbi:MAG: hypothetical protein LBI31_04510 [Zoogloeaceae bacterium]|nr:hypothetical protein [Zoogloeaceae bacterium]